MKNNTKILSLVILGVIIGSLVFAIGKNNQKNSLDNKTQSVQEVRAEPTRYEKQQNQEAEVTVEVTPIKLSLKENPEFNVVLDTHSVNLDKSLKDTSVLEDDKGNIYSPISWSGGTGGHHIEGSLIFSAFSKDVKSVKLTIKQVGGVDRIFNWILK